jgi:hypothetical protein
MRRTVRNTASNEKGEISYGFGSNLRDALPRLVIVFEPADAVEPIRIGRRTDVRLMT